MSEGDFVSVSIAEYHPEISWSTSESFTYSGTSSYKTTQANRTFSQSGSIQYGETKKVSYTHGSGKYSTERSITRSGQSNYHTARTQNTGNEGGQVFQAGYTQINTQGKGLSTRTPCRATYSNPYYPSTGIRNGEVQIGETPEDHEDQSIDDFCSNTLHTIYNNWITFHSLKMISSATAESTCMSTSERTATITGFSEDGNSVESTITKIIPKQSTRTAKARCEVYTTIHGVAPHRGNYWEAGRIQKYGMVREVGDDGEERRVYKPLEGQFHEYGVRPSDADDTPNWPQISPYNTTKWYGLITRLMTTNPNQSFLVNKVGDMDTSATSIPSAYLLCGTMEFGRAGGRQDVLFEYPDAIQTDTPTNFTITEYTHSKTSRVGDSENGFSDTTLFDYSTIETLNFPEADNRRYDYNVQEIDEGSYFNIIRNDTSVAEDSQVSTHLAQNAVTLSSDVSFTYKRYKDSDRQDLTFTVEDLFIAGTGKRLHAVQDVLPIPVNEGVNKFTLSVPLMQQLKTVAYRREPYLRNGEIVGGTSENQINFENGESGTKAVGKGAEDHGGLYGELDGYKNITELRPMTGYIEDVGLTIHGIQRDVRGLVDTELGNKDYHFEPKKSLNFAPIGETANYENSANSTIIPFHMLGANLGNFPNNYDTYRIRDGRDSNFPADPGAYIANFFSTKHILFLGCSTYSETTKDSNENLVTTQLIRTVAQTNPITSRYTERNEDIAKSFYRKSTYTYFLSEVTESDKSIPTLQWAFASKESNIDQANFSHDGKRWKIKMQTTSKGDQTFRVDRTIRRNTSNEAYLMDARASEGSTAIQNIVSKVYCKSVAEIDHLFKGQAAPAVPPNLDYFIPQRQKEYIMYDGVHYGYGFAGGQQAGNIYDDIYQQLNPFVIGGKDAAGNHNTFFLRGRWGQDTTVTFVYEDSEGKQTESVQSIGQEGLVTYGANMSAVKERPIIKTIDESMHVTHYAPWGKGHADDGAGVFDYNNYIGHNLIMYAHVGLVYGHEGGINKHGLAPRAILIEKGQIPETYDENMEIKPWGLPKGAFYTTFLTTQEERNSEMYDTWTTETYVVTEVGQPPSTDNPKGVPPQYLPLEEYIEKVIMDNAVNRVF